MIDVNELLMSVTNEQSFLHFLRVLRAEVEKSEQECAGRFCQACGEGHIPFSAFATKDYLRSAEDWGSRGDFGEGQHYDEPMLRRVAAMLFSAAFKLRD